MSTLWSHEGDPNEGESPYFGEDSEDAVVVRTMYQALEDEDTQALAYCADASIEWIHPMVTRLPFDGTRCGLPAVLQGAFRRGLAGTGPRIRAETFLEFGDGVLVAGRFYETRGAAQDGLVEEPFLQECFVRSGKVIRIREYLVQGRTLS